MAIRLEIRVSMSDIVREAKPELYEALGPEEVHRTIAHANRTMKLVTLAERQTLQWIRDQARKHQLPLTIGWRDIQSFNYAREPYLITATPGENPQDIILSRRIGSDGSKMHARALLRVFELAREDLEQDGPIPEGATPEEGLGLWDGSYASLADETEELPYTF